MRTILCYGDSNTFGYAPVTRERYPRDVRWPGVFVKLLGEDYEVIEEGCNGRTTVFDDPDDDWKNGKDYLKACLSSHKPVDLVIFMLGSNDLKENFHAAPQDIADGMECLVNMTEAFTMEKQGFVPKMILVSPPEIGENIENTVFGGRFLHNAVERSRQLPTLYQEIAKRHKCHFLKGSSVTKPSEADALHLMPESHANLARALAAMVLEEVFVEALS